MVFILKFKSKVLCMLSSCECCCKLRGVWMSWITFILATPPAEEETRRGLTKNAKEAENRQQKWWNYTPEGLETLSVSKSKMENRWNEHMIKFEWVESLLAPPAAREAGLEEQKWTDCTRNFIPMQLRSFFIAISACFLTSDIHSSDASMLSIWNFLPSNWSWRRNNINIL